MVKRAFVKYEICVDSHVKKNNPILLKVWDLFYDDNGGKYQKEVEKMSTEPKRILHITEMLSAAGIESFIMNMYRNIDRNEVQFDFLVLRDEKEFYDDEVAALGGKKYFVHSNIDNTLLRILVESRKIKKFLRNIRQIELMFCNQY